MQSHLEVLQERRGAVGKALGVVLADDARRFHRARVVLIPQLEFFHPVELAQAPSPQAHLPAPPSILEKRKHFVVVVAADNDCEN